MRSQKAKSNRIATHRKEVAKQARQKRKTTRKKQREADKRIGQGIIPVEANQAQMFRLPGENKKADWG